MSILSFHKDKRKIIHSGVPDQHLSVCVTLYVLELLGVLKHMHALSGIVIQTRICIASNTRRAHPRKGHVHALLTYAVEA